MPRKTASNPTEKKLLDDIDAFGWHGLHILGDDEYPPFSYTVGLFHSYGHPELLIYGLPRDVAHAILRIAAQAAASGQPIDLSAPTDALLEGYDCAFVPVPLEAYPDHVGFARWYYGDDTFPVVQVVWPDKSGRFPWDADAPAGFDDAQPVLGRPSAP